MFDASRKTLVFALALPLAGCAVGPNYAGPPEVAAAAVAAPTFHRAGEAIAGAPHAQWWLDLNDAQLNGLVEAALKSPDIAIAEARLRQSRAGLKQSRTSLLPSGSASTLYLRADGLGNALAGASGGNPGAAGNSVLEFYNAGFDASWEVDVFGGKRRGVEGAIAQVHAAEARLEDVKVSLAAEVAQAYVSLRSAQENLALNQRNVEIEVRLLDLTQRRRDGGAASDLDVERLNLQVQSTRADAIPLRAQVDEQLNRLAVLTGRAPGELDEGLSTASPIPAPPAVVNVGDPASLLRRRPDIRAAEQALIQKNAAIGQRIADRFPKVTLLGVIGFGSTDASDLLNSNNSTSIFAPMLQWQAVDFGLGVARVEQARGEMDEAEATYRKTVLAALQDAETSLSRYGRQRQNLASLSSVQASADRAAAMMQKRVEGGTATTLDVLDAERQRISAEQSVAQAKAMLTQDYIALQKSLGLGWARDQP
jgi:NodT family efflux transporter outer membrane factor (OMF) lipoprotein